MGNSNANNCIFSQITTDWSWKLEAEAEAEAERLNLSRAGSSSLIFVTISWVS
jgi:hypothetical protein